jgi:hypothetical protein
VGKSHSGNTSPGPNTSACINSPVKNDRSHCSKTYYNSHRYRHDAADNSNIAQNDHAQALRIKVSASKQSDLQRKSLTSENFHGRSFETDACARIGAANQVSKAQSEKYTIDTCNNSVKISNRFAVLGQIYSTIDSSNCKKDGNADHAQALRVNIAAADNLVIQQNIFSSEKSQSSTVETDACARYGDKNLGRVSHVAGSKKVSKNNVSNVNERIISQIPGGVNWDSESNINEAGNAGSKTTGVLGGYSLKTHQSCKDTQGIPGNWGYKSTGFTTCNSSRNIGYGGGQWPPNALSIRKCQLTPTGVELSCQTMEFQVLLITRIALWQHSQV